MDMLGEWVSLADTFVDPALSSLAQPPGAATGVQALRGAPSVWPWGGPKSYNAPPGRSPAIVVILSTLTNVLDLVA
jgi:hypothetical protein